jgi:hypothetical protein
VAWRLNSARAKRVPLWILNRIESLFLGPIWTSPPAQVPQPSRGPRRRLVVTCRRRGRYHSVRLSGAQPTGRRGTAGRPEGTAGS